MRTSLLLCHVGVIAALCACTTSPGPEPPPAQPAAEQVSLKGQPRRPLDPAAIASLNQDIMGLDRQIHDCAEALEFQRTNTSVEVSAACSDEHLRGACEKVAEMADWDDRVATAPNCRRYLPPGD